MTRKLRLALGITLGLTLGLNGCATLAVAVGCGALSSYGNGGKDCDAHPEVWDAAAAVDLAVLEAVTSPGAGKSSPTPTVAMHGAVTADGVPVAGARVELVSHVGTVIVVHTGPDGTYAIPEINTVVGECSGLRLVVTHPDARPSGSVGVECGEHRYDYGFSQG